MHFCKFAKHTRLLTLDFCFLLGALGIFEYLITLRGRVRGWSEEELNLFSGEGVLGEFAAAGIFSLW